MDIVTIELQYRRVEVDLSRLTPPARALAEVISSSALPVRSPIILQSVRTRREMLPPESEEPFRSWYTEAELDEVDRTVWNSWAYYPADSAMDVHDYLESEARKLPLGYYPLGPSGDAAKDAADLIDKGHVLEVLREGGRPISASTMDNYRSRPPKGWPQPVTYVGRTPLWSRDAVSKYASGLGEDGS